MTAPKDKEERDERLSKIREAIEALRSDVRYTVEQYEKNGPTWTTPGGSEMYSASFVLDKAEELTASIDEILAMLDPAPAPKE